MANQRGSGLSVTPVDFTGSVSAAGPLPSSVAGVADKAADASTAVFGALGAKVGALADQLAGDEGRRAGLAAGTDPAFRPTNGFTIRDQSFDRAATGVYLSNLEAKFHSDALDLSEKFRNDPGGLKQGLDGLVATYKKDHVFPEVDGAFTAMATNLGTTLRKAAYNRWLDDQHDRQQATLIGNMAARQTDAQRILAVDPHSPEAEQAVLRLRDQDIADIRQQVASQAITAVQGEKLEIKRRQEAQEQIVMARADTLDAAGVEAYRTRLKDDFAKAKLDIGDWESLDAELVKLGKAKGAAQQQARRALDGDIDALLKRQQSGLDSSAEWAALEARGKQVGPDGIAAVAAARDKLAIRRKIASLAPDEADLYVQRLEEGAKAAGTAPIDRPGAFATGYSPQAMGDRIEGGYEAARPGPDGRAVARTLEDVRTGRSTYVTLAGDPSFYGREYVLPSVSWVVNGQRHTLTNVRGVVHDTGSAFTGAPEGRFDIAVARDLDQQERNQSMRGVQFVPKGAGVSAHAADLVTDARGFAADRRKLVSNDPLAAASVDGIVPSVVPVDFALPPDRLAGAFAARVAQADAVAEVYRRPPSYIRPDEKPVLLAKLEKGGDAAIDTVVGLVAGAGPRAPAVLREIGDEAPGLAWAANVKLRTGDPQFAREIGEAQAARHVGGQKVASPKERDVEQAMKTVVGDSLVSMSPTELAHTKAAAILWTEREMARRGVTPDQVADVQSLLAEGVQKARGQTSRGGTTYGGIAEVGYGPPNWRGSSIAVQVPTDVRADRFGDLVAAITDADLAGLKDPPISPSGKVLTAAELRRNAPQFVPGGYAFAKIDGTTKATTQVAAKSGAAFVLPWNDLAPALRARVPDAFR